MDLRPISYLRKVASRAQGGPVWRGGPGDIVATVFEDGTILDVSASAAEVIGAAGNLIGRSLYDFVRREDRGAVRAALQCAADQGEFAEGHRRRAEFGLLRVRRAVAPSEITFRPLGRGRLTALIRDRAEEFAKAREARAAAERPARADSPASLDADRIADLSHEMKTPLGAIMGFADAMRSETFGPLGADQNGAEKYKEYAEFIHASGAHLMELIATILDSAKMKAGRYALDPKPTDPASIARDCAAMIRGEAERAGLEFVVTIAPDLPQAMIDARAVKQILINLLSNAVKFTSSGEIALSVEEKCGALDFTVRDTGIGMNRTVLAKLGGRFSDTHQNGVRGTEGTGLGLSLCFSLAKLHGGALRLDSEPGEGTTARLTLPLRRNRAEPAPALGYNGADIQSQLDRVNAYRRERARAASAA